VFKKLLIILIIAIAAVSFWFLFAIWTGLYAVYSIPPSKANPDGATLIVSRDEGEPMFDSPQYKPPPKEKSSGGIVFAPQEKPRRSLEQRTIVELPYVDWAYRKSLEPSSTE
jgi:hypothetical protein